MPQHHPVLVPRRSGAEGLDFAPYPGDLGKRIYDKVSAEAFAALEAPDHAGQREPPQPR